MEGVAAIAATPFLLLDAVVIRAPGGDAFFDLFGFEVLGEGFVDEGWKFSVGGET